MFILFKNSFAEEKSVVIPAAEAYGEWSKQQVFEFGKQDVPADMVDKVDEYYEQLIETALEVDDDLLMAYMEGDEVIDLKSCSKSQG